MSDSPLRRVSFTDNPVYAHTVRKYKALDFVCVYAPNGVLGAMIRIIPGVVHPTPPTLSGESYKIFAWPRSATFEEPHVYTWVRDNANFPAKAIIRISDPFELIGEDPVLQLEWSDDRQRASNFVYAQKATISADQKLALLNSLGYPSWEDVFYNLWHPSIVPDIPDVVFNNNTIAMGDLWSYLRITMFHHETGDPLVRIPSGVAITLRVDTIQAESKVKWDGRVDSEDFFWTHNTSIEIPADVEVGVTFGYFDSKPSAKALRFFFVDEQGEGKSIYAISDRDISSVSLLTDTFQVSLVS